MSVNNYSPEDEEFPEELEHLFARDTETVQFPDRIYALGGGGRKIVLEMFSQDWVAVEAMRNRSQDIDLVFMDSASENEENHAQEIAELQENLKSLEQSMQEWTGPAVDVGGFNIQDELITEHINVSNRAALLGEEPIEEIQRHTDAQNWWVRREHLNAVDERGDFYDVSQGAVKRRALGKALHYKALAQGSQRYEDSMVSNVEESEIAIFTGFGGGTGSGTVIDVARKIRQHNEAANIQLFSTLPASAQRDQAQANAFAALSELEYLNLSGETPFNDMFLFPLEPTELDSETTDNPQLRELDRAMTYAVLGVYNATDLDFALSNTKSYSPFTVVVPQVLRYSRDEIKEKKDAIHSLLEAKREILNHEYDNIDAIEEHLDSHHPMIEPVAGDELSDEAREYIITRLEQFEQLLTSALLEKLEIEITEDSEQFLVDIYGDNFDPAEVTIREVVRRRGLDAIIESIEYNVDIQGIEDGRVDNYAEFGDEFINDIAYTELARLTRVYNTLCRLKSAEQTILNSDQNRISTDADTKLLETLLVPSLERGVRKKRYQSLKANTEDVDQRVRETRDELEDAREELEKEREAFQNEVSNYTGATWRDMEPLIADFATLSEIELQSNIREVTTALNDFASNLATESDVDVISESGVETALDDLSREITADLQSELGQNSDIDISGLRDDILESLSTAKVARKRWDELNAEAESGGLLTGLFGSDDQGTVDTSKYRTPYEQVNAAGVFDLPRPPNTQSALERTDYYVDIDIDLESRVKSKLEQLQTDIRTQLVTEFESLLDQLDQEDETEDASPGFGTEPSMTSQSNWIEQFKRELREATSADLKSRVETILSEAVKEEIDTEIETYEAKIEELEERLTSIEHRQERLDDSFGLFEQLTSNVSDPIWDRHAAFEDQYSNDVFDVPHQRTKRHSIDSLYEHEVTPADLSSAVKKQSLAETDLLQRSAAGQLPQERQDIRKSFSKLTSNRVLDSRYNGLKRTRLNTANIASFDETGVYVAYASEALSNGSNDSGKLTPSDFDDVKKKLVENLDINEISNQYDQWFISNGDPWEVSMCVYIQGITFLDNLRDLTANDGYWARYQELVHGGNESRTIERHAFGLERGFYAARSELIDVAGRPDFFLEQSAEEIRSELIDLHQQTGIGNDVEVVDGQESDEIND